VEPKRWGSNLRHPRQNSRKKIGERGWKKPEGFVRSNPSPRGIEGAVRVAAPIAELKNNKNVFLRTIYEATQRLGDES